MLADLAASESAKRTEARYQRLEECKFVNLGLSALGNCVAALAKVDSLATKKKESFEFPVRRNWTHYYHERSL